MKRTFRSYSFMSLALIVAAAGAILVTYRAIAIRGIETAAETNNLAMAQLALAPMRHELAEYLALAATQQPGPIGLALPEPLDEAISELMRDSHVARVKIYTRSGIVAFSTREDQIGADQSNNPGFAAAMKGRVSVKFIYRDTLNPFDNATEDDNLVQSYIPVRRRATEPVVGVFEIYTDVNELVKLAERSEMLLFASTVLVLALLYLGLLAGVRRTRRLVETQQHTIHEKTAVLEALSRESLRREERERKKFASDLHEGLAQSLTAVKVALEGVQHIPGGLTPDTARSVIPELQAAIGQVRAIAMDLRPQSLDDLGLVATIEVLCRAFERSAPGIRVERNFDAPEELISAPLKIVIYRITEAALKVIEQESEATTVRLDLHADPHAVTLSIEDDGTSFDAPALLAGGSIASGPFSTMYERAVMSGGRFTLQRSRAGGLRIVTAWTRNAVFGARADSRSVAPI